jgi:hypothetical protein
MAQRFGGYIQSIGGIVCAATGVVTTGWHLLARMDFYGDGVSSRLDTKLSRRG